MEGESAVLASVADHLGHERGWELAGRPPLLPLLVAILVACDVPATVALRWADAVLAALLAPLLVLLGRRLGLASGASRAAGVLLAIHPLALAEAGGIAPGTAALGAVLLLGALTLSLDAGPRTRRAGVALGLLLPLADPIATLYLPGLLWGYAKREPSRRLRRVVPALGTGLLLLGPASLAALVGRLAWGGLPGVAAALLALGLGGLVVLWLGVPVGVARVWTGEAPAQAVRRAWLIAAGVHALFLPALGDANGALPWALVAPALPLLPLVLLTGTAGLLALPRRWWRRLAGGALGGAAAASLWVVWGGLQLVMAPGAPGAAGRLHLLGRAVTEAADAAGEHGWIVLAVAQGSHAEQTSLADLNPRHWTWAAAGNEDAADDVPGLRRLRPFPAAAFEPGQSVAVVAEAGATGEVHTFDGAGIYRQEVVRQVGPYVILRACRP